MVENGTERRIDVGERILIFIGPEGSGKTKVTTLLSDISGKRRFSTGDKLRSLSQDETSRWQEECQIMFQSATYLAGESLISILSEEFGDPSYKGGMILDGCFRTVEETRDFPKVLEKSGLDHLPVAVIYLNIPRNVSVKRLIDRGRKDDIPESIEKRLNKFELELDKRLSLIQELGIPIFEVDANKSFDEVFTEIEKLVSSLQAN